MSHRQSPETVRRILAWRAQGHSLATIAANLGISPGTVRNIVRQSRQTAALATGGRPGDNR